MQHADKTPASPRQAGPASDQATASPGFLDNRTEAATQRLLAQAIQPRLGATAQRAVSTSPRMVAQRQQLRGLFGQAAQLEGADLAEEAPIEEEQGPAEPKNLPKKDDVLQGMFASSANNNTGLLQHHQVLQRSPNFDFTTKFASSGYQSADRSDQTIYALVNNDDDCVYYIGKSVDAARRFVQHRRTKGLGTNFVSVVASQGSWTAFETATYEQYYIGLCGGTGVLLNSINGLTFEKWDWFATPKGEDQNKKQCTKLKSAHF